MEGRHVGLDFYDLLIEVLYRRRRARGFRLASTSGVRFRYSRQKEAARGVRRTRVLWEFNRFLPEKPCQTGTLAKRILLIFTMLQFWQPSTSSYRYTVASRFRCHSYECGSIVRGLRTVCCLAAPTS